MLHDDFNNQIRIQSSIDLISLSEVQEAVNMMFELIFYCLMSIWLSTNYLWGLLGEKWHVCPTKCPELEKILMN